MKLSDAIRLGEFALEPVHGRWMTFDKEGQPCGGCAVGRAMYAAGYRGTEDSVTPMHTFAKQVWPWMTFNSEIEYHAPCGCTYRDTLLVGVMSHLYESHHWSMTQIADWVATLEPQDAPVSVEQAERVEVRNGL